MGEKLFWNTLNILTLTFSFTQNPATLSFSGSVSNPTKVYDGTTTATLTTSNSSATLSGFVNGQGATYTGATGSYSTPNAGTGISVSATLGTGDFATSGSGFSWSNYTVPTMTLTGTGTITPLAVTATANSASMTYGGTVPTLFGTFSGTGNGLNNLSATWSTTATSSSPAGYYAINPTYIYNNGAVAGDFTITTSSSNATAMQVFPGGGSGSGTQSGITTDNNSTSNFVVLPIIQTISSLKDNISGENETENAPSPSLNSNSTLAQTTGETSVYGSNSQAFSEGNSSVEIDFDGFFFNKYQRTR